MALRAATLVAVVASLVIAAGCGAERRGGLPSEIDDGRVDRTLDYPAAGLTITIPRQARISERRRPQIFRLSLPSGPFAAAFAYRREEPLPRTEEDLRDARRRLMREVRRRDPRYRLIDDRSLRVDGEPAVELIGDQTLSGSRQRTRSVHAFKGDVEYVVEFFAEPARFPRADREAFEPMIRSLRLTGRLRR